MPIAQLRYDTAVGTWSLYWADRNRRWRRYDHFDPTPHQLDDLLKEIDEDRLSVFLGIVPLRLGLRLAISWFGCPTLPSDTVDQGGDRAVRLDLGALMVDAGLTSSTSDDACLRREATVPWPLGSHLLQPGA